MIQVVIITGIQLVFFLLMRALMKNIGALSFFFMFQVTAQSVLLECVIGPASARIYNALILATLCWQYSDRVVKRLNRIPGLLNVFKLWVLFIGWVIIASCLNGAMANFAFFSHNFFSTYAVATIVFLGGLATLNSRNEVICCLLWLGIIAAANAIFVVLQSLGFEKAWAVHSWLNPIQSDLVDSMRAMKGQWYIYGYPPGLSSYSVATGYVVLCFGLVWAMFASIALRSSRWIAGVASILLCLTAFMGAVLCMSRSSTYLWGLLFIPMFLMRSRKGALQWKSVLFTASMIFLVALAFLSFRGDAVSVSTTRTMDLERVYNVDPSQRLSLFAETWNVVMKHPLFGEGLLPAGMQTMETASHNYLIGAAVYYGIPGLCIMLGFTGTILRAFWRNSWSQEAQLGRMRWISHGLSICVLAYFGAGLVHNDGFTLGGLMGWYMISIWSVSSLRKSKSRIPHRFRGLKPRLSSIRLSPRESKNPVDG